MLLHSHGSLIPGKFDLKIYRSMKTPWQEYSRVACFYSSAPDGNLLIFLYFIIDSKLLVNFKKRNHTKRENEVNTISTFIEMIVSPDNLYDSIENENGTEIRNNYWRFETLDIIEANELSSLKAIKIIIQLVILTLQVFWSSTLKIGDCCPFCLTSPLAKFLKMATSCSFGNYLISPMLGAFIKFFFLHRPSLV